jgi:sugar/nucleoside kinase (ribokinase family)
MNPEPPPPALDLLVIGALTVDHFADGVVAPGGTVLHAVRAASGAGHRVGAITQAGPEPTARAGIAELRALSTSVLADEAPSSVAFGHDDSGGARELHLTAGPARQLAVPDPPTSRAVLWGPVANEIDVACLTPLPGLQAAILQGWLRALRPGQPVTPLPLTAMAGGLRELLAGFDLLAASHEDLAAVASEPAMQLAALRRWFGARPMLVVSAGSQGLWLGSSDRTEHLPLPRLVSTVSTVGAGDMLVALMLPGLAAGPREAAMRAMAGVAELLDRRRQP